MSPPTYSDAGVQAAVATLKRDVAGLYLQFDDMTAAEPVNPSSLPPFEGEIRCMVGYRTSLQPPTPPRTLLVYIEWLEPIATFDTTPPSEAASTPPTESKGGATAPLDIDPDSWMTTLEDGYLTLHYTVRAGGLKEHSFSLVREMDPARPYELYLFHYPNGDAEKYLEEGIVAFRLDGLPDTHGAKVQLTLKYQPLDGTEATLTFDYKTRK